MALASLLLPLLLALSSASPAPANASLEVRVELRNPGLLARELAAGVVSLRPVGVPGAPVARPLSGSRSARFVVPEGSTWEVSVHAEGTWSRPAVVRVSAAHENLAVLDVYSAGVLVGKLQVPSGTSLPSAVDLRFRPAPGAEPGLPEATESCPVVAGAFRCSLPAGRLDARLRAYHLQSRYFWGIEIPRGGRQDVGLLDLKPGASVVGWIENTAEGLRFDEVTVQLQPLKGAAQPGPDEPGRPAALAMTTRPNTRGFFELTGVAPGLYTVTVIHPRYAPARVSPVQVQPLAETELQDSVQLLPPATLEAELDPPLDPAGDPWILELSQEDAGGGHYSPVKEAAATREGRWRGERLEPGSYLLVTKDRRNSRWSQMNVTVRPGMAPVEIRLPLVEVEGNVRLGGDPLEALVWFGGVHGAERIAARSDDEGEFVAVLPQRSSWVVEVYNRHLGVAATIPDVEVRKSPGHARARVRLDVPDTTVRGIVTSESGQPAAGAAIEVFGPGNGADATAAADGRFEIRGLAAGIWRFEAKAGELGSSESVPYEVREGGPGPDLQLVVRQRLRLSGQVVDPAGGPVYGAQVVATFAGLGRLTSILPHVLTDLTGTFSLSLPAGVDSVVLTVLAPGFAVRQLSTDPRSREALIIPVRQDGGTLTVRYPEGAEGDPIRRTSIYHEGLLANPILLQGWAALHGVPPDGQRLVVPMLEPGPYTACLGLPLRDSSEAAAAEEAANCASGELVSHGELVLELRASALGAK